MDDRLSEKIAEQSKRGHMDFAEIIAAVDYREGYRMGRFAAQNGTDWYEWRNGWLCAGKYTGKGNRYKLIPCAVPSAAERKKRDWIILQNEDGRVPNL